MMPLYFYLSQWTSLPPAPKGELLEGKTAIVTGSNGGIGFEVALHLAALSPARLILAVRNLASGAEALDKILKKDPKVRVDVWELDLSSYASVKAFASRAEKELDKIDILINNAAQAPGLTPKPLKRTSDGHEQVLQVNVLSPVLLSLLLQPLLAKSAKPQLVFVSSEVHAWANPGPILTALSDNTGIINIFDDEQVYVNGARYFQSKLLLQMVIRKLIPALPGAIITAVNPGLCHSNLARDFPMDWNLAVAYRLLWLRVNGRTAEVGARNVTAAAINAEDSVEYWSDCRPEGSESTFLGTGKGFKATEVFWKEVLDEMERVVPGCTKPLLL